MKQFIPDKYEDLFENWDDPVMFDHAKDEEIVISQIYSSKEKTFIDLGAGYGRVLPILAKAAKNVISIEIDNDMFFELEKRAKKYNNVKVIHGDITKLHHLIVRENVKNPVLLILQNTLGTIEGDWNKVLSEMKNVAKKYHGEIILSLYRQQALEKWGLMTYWHGVEMNGEPNLKKTDFVNGQFESKTGYISKWWTDREINNIKKCFNGKVLNEKKAFEYTIIHIKY